MKNPTDQLTKSHKGIGNRLKPLALNIASLLTLSIICTPVLLTLFLYTQLIISGHLFTSVSHVISG